MRYLRAWLLAALTIAVAILAGCGSTATKTVTVTTPAPPTKGEVIPASAIKAPCETASSPTNAAGEVTCIPQAALRPDGAKAEAPPTRPTLTGSQIHLSHRGAQLIEGFEGFSSCPYWDSAGGVATRGYGETEGIRMGSGCISRSFGERNLIYRAERFYGFAIKRLRTSFNQNEIDAQFSFLWNLGAGIDPPGSSLARGFQRHSCAGILSYDHAGGVVLSGLSRRRRAECQRFHEPAHEETPAQRRARLHRERVKRLGADYRARRGLRAVIASHKCSHGYDHKPRDVKRKCTVWRFKGAQVNRDIRRLHRAGIR
jgi:GH24 family phage-related lysozyme (muramidase)